MPGVVYDNDLYSANTESRSIISRKTAYWVCILGTTVGKAQRKVTIIQSHCASLLGWPESVARKSFCFSESTSGL